MFGKILEIFLPTFCVSCGSLGNSFCPKCLSRLKPYSATLCFYCKKPSFLGFTHPKCKRKSSLDGVFSLFYYNEPLRRLLKAVKYRRAYKVFREFLHSLPGNYWQKAEEFFELIKDSYFVLIPLYKKRLFERGFNQAEILVSFLKDKFVIKTKDLLVRKKDNSPQVFIKLKRRRFLNTRGFFEVKEKGELPEKVILVDDVITTGKTLEAAVLVLKKKELKKFLALPLLKVS